MEFTNKAIINKKKRLKELCITAFLACVGCAAVVLGIFSVIDQNYIFAVIYLIAFFLSLIYTIMKINTIIPTFIACDSENIYMRYWENGFFPFKTGKGFIGEFIPESVKSSKITMRGIESICIGSGRFISRTLPESEFARLLKEHKNKHSGALKHMEFIHMILSNGKEKYMSVSDFDVEELSKIVKAVMNVREDLVFTSGNRKIRSKIQY